MTNDAIQTVVVVLTAVGALMAATGTTVATVFMQASKSRKEFWAGLSALSNTVENKFDTHDKKDDRRFQEVSEDIWEIRLRNARIDGQQPPHRRHQPLTAPPDTE